MIVDIISAAHRNTAYRRVVHTGELSQLVVMALRPYEKIGEETHRAVEQTLFIVDGSGTVTLDGVRRRVQPGDAIVIAPGVSHNLTAGPKPLRLFTVYTPPNHIDGRVHRTRAEAERDFEDEEFSRRRR
jgi:mannose-6-phosphate isomerase-like protein (cupin superfamily)